MPTPQRSRTASTSSAEFPARRIPAVATAAISAAPAPPGLLDHADDGIRGPPQRLRLERPGVLQPLAEPRDLGPVGHRLPAAVRTALADVELDGVGADVDHGEAHGLETQHAS